MFRDVGGVIERRYEARELSFNAICSLNIAEGIITQIGSLEGSPRVPWRSERLSLNSSGFKIVEGVIVHSTGRIWYEMFAGSRWQLRGRCQLSSEGSTTYHVDMLGRMVDHALDRCRESLSIDHMHTILV